MPDNQSLGAPQAEYADTDQYDIATLRNLIREAFTAKELERFCQDRPSFRPVLTQFGPNFSFEDMIESMVRFCQTRRMFDELLSEIRVYNPNQFQRYHHLFLSSQASSRGTTRSKSTPNSALSAEQHQGNRSLRILLYFVIVAPVLFLVCAGFNAFIYGVPSGGAESDNNLSLSHPAVLILMSVVLSVTIGILSDLIANWVFGRIDMLLPSRRAIVLLIVVICFMLTLFGSIVIAILMN